MDWHFDWVINVGQWTGILTAGAAVGFLAEHLIIFMIAVVGSVVYGLVETSDERD